LVTPAPLQAIAPQAFAPNARLNFVDRGISAVSLTGKADETLYQDHGLTGALSFNELKLRSLVNERSRAADQDPDFSRIIREGLRRVN
jgi:hypothetical protein